MLKVVLVPFVFLSLGVLGMLESLRWIVMQNRIEEVAFVMERITNDQDGEI